MAEKVYHLRVRSIISSMTESIMSSSTVRNSIIFINAFDEMKLYV